MSKTIYNSRIGESKQMNNGEYATIISYKNYNNISVEFDDGTVRKNASYDSFKKGILRKTNCNVSIGAKNVTHEGYTIEIIKCEDNRITVKFLETGNIKEVDKSMFRKKNIKNPMHPSVCGIGFPGQTYKHTDIRYNVWQRLIRKHAKKEITLCDEWLYLDNFAPFIEGYIANKSYIECNSKYYSPKTCNFIIERDIKKCEICGKEFTGSNVRFCSFKCAKIGQINDSRKQFKSYDFETMYKKFDSKLKCRIRLVDETKYNGLRGGAEIICLECGNTRYISVLNNLFKKLGDNSTGCPYCSKRLKRETTEKLKVEKLNKIQKCICCGSEYKVKNAYGNYYCSKKCYILDKKIEKICSHCSKTFKTVKDSKKFCSVKCEFKYKKEKKKREFIPKILICDCCGNTFKTEYGKNNIKYCSDKCRKRIVNRRNDKRYKILRKNGDYDKTITLEKLIKRDNNICQICGKACDINDCITKENGVFVIGKNYPSIDHIHPISKGGKHSWSNVQLAHLICNSLKNNKEGC